MSDYSITEIELGGLGGETTTAWAVMHEGKKVATCASKADATAKIEVFEARQAKVAAYGDRLRVTTEGLTKAQRTRRMRRYLVLDADGEVIAEARKLDDLPMPEVATPAEPVEAEPVAEQAPVRGTITDAQVAEITALVADGAHEEGGFYAGPTTRNGVLALSREDATTYLTSLKGDY